MGCDKDHKSQTLNLRFPLPIILALLFFVPAYSQRTVERIDLNKAGTAELASLPGLGEILASRIVEHRKKHGRFKRAQDVIVVHGMSARRYRKIAHLIRI